MNLQFISLPAFERTFATIFHACEVPDTEEATLLTCCHYEVHACDAIAAIIGKHRMKEDMVFTHLTRAKFWRVKGERNYTTSINIEMFFHDTNGKPLTDAPLTAGLPDAIDYDQPVELIYNRLKIIPEVATLSLTLRGIEAKIIKVNTEHVYLDTVNEKILAQERREAEQAVKDLIS